MAWQRTGLSMAALAATMAAIDKRDVHWLLMVPSLGVLAAGAGLLLAARRRYRVDRLVIAPEPVDRTADGRLLLLACLATTCLGLTALLAAWLR